MWRRLQASIKFAVAGSITSLVITTAAILFCIWLPALWGWQPYRVLSHSMSPIINQHNIVIVKPLADTLSPGQIITYQRPGYNVETHRIVKIEDGKIYTRGDANPSIDPDPVHPSWIIGRVVLQVPLGWR